YIKGTTPSGKKYDPVVEHGEYKTSLTQNGKVVFCVEMGVPARTPTGWKVDPADKVGASFFQGADRKKLAKIAYYGYTRHVDDDATQALGRYELATQALIWQEQRSEERRVGKEWRGG